AMRVNNVCWQRGASVLQKKFNPKSQRPRGARMEEQVLEQVDRERIVELARHVADIVSITGEEKEIAEYLGSQFEKLGMQVSYQEVEEGRPNVIGTLKGTGGGATLMFCAHMDHFDNPQETVVEDTVFTAAGWVTLKGPFPSYSRRAQGFKNGE